MQNLNVAPQWDSSYVKCLKVVAVAISSFGGNTGTEHVHRRRKA
jgi:hypothetical protein